MPESRAVPLSLRSAEWHQTVIENVNGSALLGAFAGAALIVASSHERSFFKRGLYMIISWIAGYLAAEDVVKATPLDNLGIAAFVGAALAITVTLQILERVKTFDLKALFRKH